MLSRNNLVTSVRGFVVVSVVLLGFIASAERAHASTWCVPDATIRSTCHHVSPTLQGAIDGWNAGDVIYVGPGTSAERITIDKPVVVKGLPGHVITDAGLPSGGTLMSITGTMSRGPRLDLLVLDVVTSDTGLFIAPTVTMTHMRQVRVESRQIPKPAVGVQASGTSRTMFLGPRVAALDEWARVAGFQVGMELNDVNYVNVEPALIEDNDVGIRYTRGGYQIFWNIFRNNGIALEVCGLNVTDINSNLFIENGLAVHWGLCHNPETGFSQQNHVEFNHNIFIANTENLRVEVSPGVFSNDYRDDPGCYVQWHNMRLDGVRYPFYKVPNSRVRRCQPM